MHDIQPIAKTPRIATMLSQEAAEMACFGHEMIKFLAHTVRSPATDIFTIIPGYGGYHFGDTDTMFSLEDMCLSRAKLEICGGSHAAGFLLEFLCSVHEKSLQNIERRFENCGLYETAKKAFEEGKLDIHITPDAIRGTLLGMFTFSAIRNAEKLLTDLGFVKVSKSKSVPDAKCYHLMLGAIRNALLDYYEVGQ